MPRKKSAAASSSDAGHLCKGEYRRRRQMQASHASVSCRRGALTFAGPRPGDCGFFGSPELMFFCSVCFKKEEFQRQITAPVMDEGNTASVSVRLPPPRGIVRARARAHRRPALPAPSRAGLVSGLKRRDAANGAAPRRHCVTLWSVCAGPRVRRPQRRGSKGVQFRAMGNSKSGGART